MVATATGADGAGTARRHGTLPLALNAASLIVFGLAAATLAGFPAFIAEQAPMLAGGLVVLTGISLISEHAAHPVESAVVTAFVVGRPLAAIGVIFGIGLALNAALASDTLTAPIALGLAGFVLASSAGMLQEPDARARRKVLIDLSLPATSMVAFYGLLAGGPLAPVALIALVALALIIYWRDPRRTGLNRRA